MRGRKRSKAKRILACLESRRAGARMTHCQQDLALSIVKSVTIRNRKSLRKSRARFDAAATYVGKRPAEEAYVISKKNLKQTHTHTYLCIY